MKRTEKDLILKFLMYKFARKIDALFPYLGKYECMNINMNVSFQTEVRFQATRVG